jgi:hypothetical protein
VLKETPQDPYASLNGIRFRAAKTFLDARMPFLRGAKAVPFVGILDVGEDGLPQVLALALHQLHLQAEVVSPTQELGSYPLLILGGLEDLSESDWPRLEHYVRNGGILLASLKEGMTAKAMWEYWGDPLWQRTQTLFGFHVACRGLGGTNGYLQLEPALRRNSVERGCLVKGPFWEVLAPNAEKLGKLVLPWQNLFFGFAYLQAPPDREDLSPGITSIAYGSGRAVFVTLPIFYALKSTGFTCLQDDLLDLLNYLLPAAPFHVAAAPNLEAHLMSKQHTLLLNLLYYYPNRPFTDRLDLEDSAELHNLPVQVRTPERPSAVSLKPEGSNLEFEYDNGYTKVVIPKLVDWQVLEVLLPGQ